MAISFRDLENARKNPTAFGQSLAKVQGGGGFTRGQYMDWRDAVLSWLSGSDPHETRAALESTLTDRYKSRTSTKRFPATLAAFDDLVTRISDSGLRSRLTRVNVTYVPSDGVMLPIEIRGQLPALLLGSDGHVALLLQSRAGVWQDELRSPLIQLAVCQYLNLFPDELTLACYTFESKALDLHHFADDELNQAETEARELIALVDEARIASL